MGYAACRVLDAVDLGDATLFVASIVDEQRLADEAPATWAEAQRAAGDEFMSRYQQKFASDREWSLAHMRWTS